MTERIAAVIRQCGLGPNFDQIASQSVREDSSHSAQPRCAREGQSAENPASIAQGQIASPSASSIGVRRKGVGHEEVDMRLGEASTSSLKEVDDRLQSEDELSGGGRNVPDSREDFEAENNDDEDLRDCARFVQRILVEHLMEFCSKVHFTVHWSIRPLVVMFAIHYALDKFRTVEDMDLDTESESGDIVTPNQGDF